MMKFLKIGISALALSAFVVAPAVTIVTADAAYAKNDNGNNGKGKGGGNRGGGNAGKGGDKGGDKGNRGKSGNKGGGKGKSAGSGNFGKDMKSFGRSLKNDLGGLFGKKKSKATAASKPAKSVNKPAKAQVAKVKGPMHPSNLGKLNGAINSSPNAKAAHIANGQYTKGTGPVSLAAALAVADYNVTAVEDAADTLGLADAYAALVGTTADDITLAEETITDFETNPETTVTQEDYDAAVGLVEANTTVTEAEAAGATEPTTEEIADAQSVVDGVLADYPDETDPVAAAGLAVADAEDALLNAYKGDLAASDDPDARLSEDAQNVVDAVRDANPTSAEVEASLASLAEKSAAEEDGTDDDMADGEETAEEDDTDSAMIDDQTDTSDQG